MKTIQFDDARYKVLCDLLCGDPVLSGDMDELKEYVEQSTVSQASISFIEIFKYAEAKFQVSWNEANDLFFKTEVLRYKSYNEFDQFTLFDFMYVEEDDKFADFNEQLDQTVSEGLFKESVVLVLKEFANLPEYQRARGIIASYMLDNNLDDLTVLND
jgi:hypothetical protein